MARMTTDDSIQDDDSRLLLLPEAELSGSYAGAVSTSY